MNTNELKKYENVAVSLLGIDDSSSAPTEQKIDSAINTISSLYKNLTKEDLSSIKKMLISRYEFKLDVGTMIYDEQSEPWFKEFKKRGKNAYFDRYKEYLITEKGFSYEAANVLDDDILDEIMDYLGNPETNFSPRRGLVMGDVQSGKTSTYNGLICKAADAGYKVIIVLTGTVESLRQQTQIRLDEGFVGFNSDHMSKINQDDFWVGVGKINHIRGTTLTARSKDFVASTANALNISLKNYNDPVLFVVKKNVSVLNKLYKWLKDLNVIGDKIDYPLLIIDDEADNASVNTNSLDEDSNPTKINYLIRKLLNLFSRNNYVGFTATPFANVFINPEISEDLFPKDFIYSLKSPNNYIGPSEIFSDGAKYSNSIYFNDDCEEFLPLKHKRDFKLNELPETLYDSLIAFFITNSIRDLRGDQCQNRGMLINVSRFRDIQIQISEKVNDFLQKCKDKFKLYCNMYESCEKDFALRFKNIFKTDFINCGFNFEEVWRNLYSANENVETTLVNSTSRMVNYNEYKDKGARLIVIGGLSLSRGLTIEGLCISYLYRNSQAYDTLLQMGRWFGYRSNYDDLFRVWIPTKLLDSYREINSAVEELKIDLVKMNELRQKPIDFGIRIRNNKIGLKITANNKMRTATELVVKKSMFGDWDNTGIISSDKKTNISNYTFIVSCLEKLLAAGYSFKREYGDRLILPNIPKQYIIEIINGFKKDSSNFEFDIETYKNFINKNIPELDTFDIAIIEGDRSKECNLAVAGQSIVKPMKNFSASRTSIYFNKQRALVVNPIDTSYGLTEKQKKYAEELNESLVLKANPNKQLSSIHMSAKGYLRIKDRNPLLMIYFIDLKVGDLKPNDDQIEHEKLVNLKNEFDSNKITPTALAIAIPQYYDSSELMNYKINLIEWKKLRALNDELDELIEE